jgi:transcription termination factor Rho
MSSFRPNSRRGKSRPHQRPRVPARRVVSPDEKKFLAGTAVNPHERIILEKGSDDLSVRALDLICPIGMGQRALVVSSPGLGKTTFLKTNFHDSLFFDFLTINNSNCLIILN